MKKFVLAAITSALCCMNSVTYAQTLWASHSTGVDSTIYQLDADDGSIMTSFAGPGDFADAVEQFGDSLFILDSSTLSSVYQTDLSGNLQNTFNITGFDAEGLGILDNGNLVIGDGSSAQVVTFDQSGNVVDTFVTSENVFGLDTNGVDEIYTLGIGGLISTYDLDGNLLNTLDSGLGGVNTLGLAYTGSSFFIGETTTDQITEIDLSGNTLNSFSAPDGFVEGLDYVGNAIPEPTSTVVLCFAVTGLLVRRKRK